MPISFPTNPADSDTHVIGSITYQYNATDDKWTGLGISPSDRLIEGSNKLEIDASNNLVWTGNNVSIGTGNTTQKLNVGGNISIQESGILYFDASSGFSPRIANSTSINDLSIFTNNLERLTIDSSGRVLQGLTSAKFGFFNDNNAPPVFQIQGDTYYDSALSIFRDGTGASGPNFILAKGREAIVQDNDILGTISFQGHDGTTELIEGASIVTEVDGTPSANNVPSALVFKTNSGTSTSTERFRITSAGDLALGTNNPAAGAAGGYDRVFNIQAGSSSALSSISFGDSNATGRIESVNGNNGKILINGSEYIAFGTGGTPVERLRIDSDGDVGIGLNGGNPEARLHVEENLSHSSTYYLNGDAHILVDNPNTDATSKSVLKLEGEAAIVYGGGSSTLIFADRQNERLRIDSAGDLIQGPSLTFWQKNGNALFLISSGESTPTVYVSDSGNDSTGDGTSSNPFRTLSKAWYYVPRVFSHNHAPRILIKGTSYTVDSVHYCRGGAAGGNWQWGPAIDIKSESGSQIDVYLRAGIRFENVDGLRFQNLNFICDDAGGYLYFNSCTRGKIYTSCDMTVSVTKGWSERVGYYNCRNFVDEMDINVTSAVTAGLGGLVTVYDKSILEGTRSITKAGAQFGNHAVAVVNGSHLSCNWDITNFSTGFSLGLNHYNAETGGTAMLNGVTISNCDRAIRLWNDSYVRKFSVTFSGNNTNEDIQTGSFSN